MPQYKTKQPEEHLLAEQNAKLLLWLRVTGTSTFPNHVTELEPMRKKKSLLFVPSLIKQASWREVKTPDFRP